MRLAAILFTLLGVAGAALAFRYPIGALAPATRASLLYCHDPPDERVVLRFGIPVRDSVDVAQAYDLNWMFSLGNGLLLIGAMAGCYIMFKGRRAHPRWAWWALLASGCFLAISGFYSLRVYGHCIGWIGVRPFFGITEIREFEWMIFRNSVGPTLEMSRFAALAGLAFAISMALVVLLARPRPYDETAKSGPRRKGFVVTLSFLVLAALMIPFNGNRALEVAGDASRARTREVNEDRDLTKFLTPDFDRAKYEAATQLKYSNQRKSNAEIGSAIKRFLLFSWIGAGFVFLGGVAIGISAIRRLISSGKKPGKIEPHPYV